MDAFLLLSGSMKEEQLRVALPPERPVMIFDGDCVFCRAWIARWHAATGARVEYRPQQAADIRERFPEIPIADLKEAVCLITTDGAVYRGARAVFECEAVGADTHWPLWGHTHMPGFALVTEAAYRLIARNRNVFTGLMRLLWGNDVLPDTSFISRYLFLRILGLVFLVAFVSFWTQAAGLVGSRGILPAAELMSSARSQLSGIERIYFLPTLCWISATDMSIFFQCALGCACAVLLMLGIVPLVALLACWLTYLSVCTIGGDFLQFQWDALLLETGLLSLFICPAVLLHRPGYRNPPSRFGMFLLTWLLFRLMFESGLVKLLSGDITWRGLTALRYHYETQPLPTPLAWYAQQLPGWFQTLSTGVTLFIELIAPLMLFLPRRGRVCGLALLITLQVLILLTGNYGFFNMLALALCLLLVADRFWPRSVRKHFAGQAPVEQMLVQADSGPESAPEVLPEHRGRRFRLVWLSYAAGVLLAVASTVPLLAMLTRGRMPGALAAVYLSVSPLRSTNSYGLFAVMTTTRPEIELQGSMDGETWQPYVFRYKAGPLDRRPPVIAPFMPRLDWQMWFEALRAESGALPSDWFLQLCERLLQGSHPVQALFEKTPFQGKPPRHLRAMLYSYHFTTLAERKQTGNWWKRELIGQYGRR